MPNMGHRKRISKTEHLKVVDENSELQQRNAHLHKDNDSLRRKNKKLKRKYKKLERKSSVCAPRQACSRPLVRASRDRSSVCVRASCDAEGHLSAQPETVPQDGQGGGQGGGLD